MFRSVEHTILYELRRGESKPFSWPNFSQIGGHCDRLVSDPKPAEEFAFAGSES